MINFQDLQGFEFIHLIFMSLLDNFMSLQTQKECRLGTLITAQTEVISTPLESIILLN